MNSTLTKGLHLLELLARSKTPLGVTEVAQRLSLAKSDAHRLLQTLVLEGFARQEPGGAYRTSTKVWELGSAMVTNLDLRQMALPWMHRLLMQTNEMVALAVLDGDDAVYLHMLDSPQPVRTHLPPGARAAAHCVATGKAMLAMEPIEWLTDRSRRLVRHTSRTLVDPETFLKDMARTRARGYAINQGEWRESVSGVGACVVDATGTVLGALGVSGPSERLRKRLKEFGEFTLTAAQAFGAEFSSHHDPGRR